MWEARMRGAIYHVLNRGDEELAKQEWNKYNAIQPRIGAP
jgi:hypothetical protein